MTDGNAARGRIALAASLLVLAPLAGCLEPIGEATQDALTDGDHARQADATERGPVQTEEIDDRYRAAFQKLDPEREAIRQAEVSMHMDPVAEDREPVKAQFYLDIPDEIAILSFTNSTPAEEPSPQLDTVLVGAVHQTGFFGTGSTVMGTYNDSHSWEETARNLSNMSTGESSTMDPSENLFEPTRIFADLREIPDGAIADWNETTYEGEPAREIHVQHDNATQDLDLAIVVHAETERPLHLEGRIGNASSLSGPADVEMDFRYADDADHRLADELVRLETMTIHDADDTKVTLAANETKTWTVQPSQNPGTIPLEDVEVQLRGSTGTTGLDESQLHLALPAEDGEVTTENATLIYRDADGDGHVSPGDEVTFTPHTRNVSSWRLALEDEKTGMRMASGPGTLVLAVAIVGVGALARRDR